MNLQLELLEPQHASQLFAALNHEEVGRFIGGPDVTTVEELEARIRARQVGPHDGKTQKWINLAVLLDSIVIGRVEATVHDGITEIAYLINPSLWGKGYGTAATKLLIERLINEGQEEFWATAVPENVASIRVMQKLGFIEVEAQSAPELFSYDDGDRVFLLRQ